MQHVIFTIFKYVNNLNIILTSLIKGRNLASIYTINIQKYQTHKYGVDNID